MFSHIEATGGPLIPTSHPFVSIVVPTFDESENIEALLRGFKTLVDTLGQTVEFLIIDDQSPDGTAELAERTAEGLELPVRVLVRRSSRSMGRAVVAGLEAATGDIVCVMDADLSHPASLIPKMLDHLNGFDGVVASRYIDGGAIVGWPLRRRAISLVATRLARKIVGTGCSDPLSGFFLFRRSCLDLERISGRGHKPLLEILADGRLTVVEVPYEFRDRHKGKSKLGLQGIVSFLALILERWSGRPGRHPAGASPAFEAVSESRDP